MYCDWRDRSARGRAVRRAPEIWFCQEGQCLVHGNLVCVLVVCVTIPSFLVLDGGFDVSNEIGTLVRVCLRGGQEYGCRYGD